MDKRTITIKIADHTYSLTIPADQESSTRKCVDILTKYISEKYVEQGRSFDDVLIFLALNVLRENQVLQERLASCKSETEELSRKLKEYIAKQVEI